MAQATVKPASALKRNEVYVLNERIFRVVRGAEAASQGSVELIVKTKGRRGEEIPVYFNPQFQLTIFSKEKHAAVG